VQKEAGKKGIEMERIRRIRRYFVLGTRRDFTKRKEEGAMGVHSCGRGRKKEDEGRPIWDEKAKGRKVKKRTGPKGEGLRRPNGVEL